MRSVFLAVLAWALVGGDARAQDHIYAAPTYQLGTPTYPGELKTTGCIASPAAGTELSVACNSGHVGIGAADASGGAQLTVRPLNASTTVQINNGAASQTADLQQWAVAGSTGARISADGGLGIMEYTKAQLDTRVPRFRGELVFVNNYSNSLIAPSSYVLCRSSGTAAAQYEVVGGTHGVNMNGCGTGQ